MALMVGQVLYGFCGGWFGRDSYSDKRIEAVGADWVVAREENGNPVFAQSHVEDGAVTWSIHEALAEYVAPEKAD